MLPRVADPLVNLVRMGPQVMDPPGPKLDPLGPQIDLHQPQVVPQVVPHLVQLQIPRLLIITIIIISQKDLSGLEIVR